MVTGEIRKRVALFGALQDSKDEIHDVVRFYMSHLTIFNKHILVSEYSRRLKKKINFQTRGIERYICPPEITLT